MSPKLHNYWIKENNIDAVYEKKKLNALKTVLVINKFGFASIGAIIGGNIGQFLHWIAALVGSAGGALAGGYLSKKTVLCAILRSP